MNGLLWFSALLAALGAVMLLLGLGASLVWFGAIAAGCALFVVERTEHRRSH